MAVQFKNSVVVTGEEHLGRKRARSEESKPTKPVKEKIKFNGITVFEDNKYKIAVDMLIPEYLFNFLSKRQHDYIVQILAKTGCELSFPAVTV